MVCLARHNRATAMGVRHCSVVESRPAGVAQARARRCGLKLMCRARRAMIVAFASRESGHLLVVMGK